LGNFLLIIDSEKIRQCTRNYRHILMVACLFCVLYLNALVFLHLMQ
jgi:hypothetical protein